MRKLFSLLSIAGALCVQNTAAQSDTDQQSANNRLQAAVTLMDNGQVDSSLILLEEGRKLFPDNIDFPYEMAYAKYLTKDYNAAADLLKKLQKHKDVSDRVYQLLGNCYDYLGKPKKAIDSYDDGLERFPGSGPLHLERGIMEMKAKQYGRALAYFEAGINGEPTFTSNYYWAAKIFCSQSEEEVWGMIYGEIFINLERGSKRTEEISKLLYYTYKSEIQFPNDTSVSVSFHKDNTINIGWDPKSGPEDLAKQLMSALNRSFPGVYEQSLMLSVVGEKIINLQTLDSIRTRFLDIYAQQGKELTVPVPIFDYQRQLRSLGYLDAYNYWALGLGSQQEFEDWRIANQDKWDKFIAWFREHGLQVTNENKFTRPR
ncbi:hypothetical protein F0L74_22115 [Chitinophaga agrisoli]|uniref:Uncharacterized protein n=1 Tax=Chitinophaga agrisoli TaxID=2607653 RepID=A0A5B2VH59_9BACT|nr:hypothetical protein [Chitinophaga agrisoli]KAA2238913.1 hypothetical protein F0L74_22115 [Chitinophaga agrisoli]